MPDQTPIEILETGLTELHDTPEAPGRPKHVQWIPEVKNIDHDNRTLDAVFSTNDIDEDGEIIEPMAFADDLQRFMRNPVLLANHGEGYEGKVAQIGSIKRLEIARDGSRHLLVGTAKFATTPLAEEHWILYSEGHMRAFSIGFKPLRSGYKSVNGQRVRVVTRGKLFEISACPIGVNEHALVMHKALQKHIGGDVEKMITKSISETLGKLVDSDVIGNRIDEAINKSITNIFTVEPGGDLQNFIEDTVEVVVRRVMAEGGEEKDRVTKAAGEGDEEAEVLAAIASECKSLLGE